MTPPQNFTCEKRKNTMKNTEQKHTPGPWQQGDANGERNIYAADQTVICRMEVWRGSDADEADANAALIASAPELLAALSRLVREAGYESGEAEPTIHDLSASRAAFDEARAAISKATGRGEA